MGDFVGRAAELTLLDRHVVAGTSGAGPTAVIVFGAAGSGKSRVIREAARRAGHQPIVLQGFEPERDVPLAAARSLLRELSRTPGPGERLAALLDAAPQASDALEPLRILEAADRCLEARDAVLLLADDLQWVDPLSAALLHFLLRSATAGDRSLVLLGAAREDPGARGFAEAVLAQLPTDRAAVLELEPLSEDESVALALAASPGMDVDRARSVGKRSGGSPFWIEALARTGEARDASLLLTVRLRGSSPDARALTALLAVAGRPVRSDDAAAILGWRGDRLEAASSELVARGIAVAGAARPLALAHDLIREAAAQELPDAERRRLHSAIAAHLEASAGEDLALLREALEHLRAAGAATVPLALRLARSPRRRLLGAQGLALLLVIADEAPPQEPTTLELEREVATVADEVGELRASFARWERLRRRLHDPNERARAALAASRLRMRLGDAPGAEALLASARAEPVTDEPLELELVAHEALLLRHLHRDSARGRATILAALGRARALIAAHGSVTSVPTEGRAAYLKVLEGAYDAARLDDDDADAMLALADEMARTGGAATHGVPVLPNAPMALRAQGRWAEASEQYRLDWEEAQRAVLPSMMAEIGYWYADTLYVLGRFAEASAIAEETMRIGHRVQDARATSDARWVLRLLDLARGEWRTAADAIEGEILTEDDAHYRLEPRSVLADALLRLGDEGDRGRALAELAALEADVAAGCRRCRLETMLLSAAAYARADDPSRARALLLAWDGEARTPSAVARFRRSRAEGLVRLAEGDAEGAELALRAAVEAADRLGMAVEAMRARIDLSRATQDKAQAVEALTTAMEAAVSIGASTERSQAERALRAHGVRGWRRGAARTGATPVDRLSARELEVARLVAGGASNREIANALFLSPKTIETHVSNVLAKVGARNRTELASLLTGHEARGA